MCIQVLPLLTLRQYFCSTVCRDVEQTVSSRILRVRVLADLGLYSEAFTVIHQLLNGEYLIQPGDSSFGSKEGGRSLVYNSSKSPTDIQNQKVHILKHISVNFNKYCIFKFYLLQYQFCRLCFYKLGNQIKCIEVMSP